MEMIQKSTLTLWHRCTISGFWLSLAFKISLWGECHFYPKNTTDRSIVFRKQKQQNLMPKFQSEKLVMSSATKEQSINKKQKRKIHTENYDRAKIQNAEKYVYDEMALHHTGKNLWPKAQTKLTCDSWTSESLLRSPSINKANVSSIWLFKTSINIIKKTHGLLIAAIEFKIKTREEMISMTLKNGNLSPGAKNCTPLDSISLNFPCLLSELRFIWS